MKLNLAFLLPIAALVVALSPQSARADSVTFALSNPIQSITAAGGTLTFIGTITAAGTNTGFEYLNSDTFTTGGPGTLNDTAFLNGPTYLTAGQSYTGTLFTVSYPSNAALGTYFGSFGILGGSTDSAQNNIGSAAFQTSVAPEPSSLILLCIGLMGIVGVMRPRMQS